MSLGTSTRFGFRRLIERLVTILPRHVEVLWQTGCTDVSGLGISAPALVPERELRDAIERSDVVVAHAGAGIAVTILAAGKVPVLVPRSAAVGEHVDNHQEQIAGRLAGLGLALVSTVEDLTLSTLQAASGRRAVREAAPPFVLDRR